MRKSLWFMLALLFLAIGPPDARANDTVVTLDVSGTMSPVFAGASCPPAGCTLGGNIVLDNTEGFVISADVTLAGASSPSEGPFTQFAGFDFQDSLLVLAGGPGGVLGL